MAEVGVPMVVASALGVGLLAPGDKVGVFVFCCVFTFAVVTAIWVAGLFQGNHSMMDGYYGFGFAVPTWIAFWVSGAQSQIAALLLLMASLHGCRLCWYLAARWKRYTKIYGGDPRYLGFTEKYSPGYWWKSFFVVMEPQAVVIIVIGLPAVWGILEGQAQAAHPGPLTALGMIVFGIGLYYETAADAQLQAFLADKPHNEGRYLRTGVWTHSRHPNYFGNTLVWWGIWIVSVSGTPGAWWTVVGPVINTIMLTKVLGTAFQDRYMGDRPDYKRLMSQTRGFLPFPTAGSRKPPEVEPEVEGASTTTGAG
jgi:steroid 5-alpha reductase family enzyme